MHFWAVIPTMIGILFPNSLATMLCVFPKFRRHVDCILRHRHFRPLELLFAQIPPVGKHIRIHKLSHFWNLSKNLPMNILFDSIQPINMQFWLIIFNCFWYEWFITYAFIQFDSCDYNLFKLQFDDNFWQGS